MTTSNVDLSRCKMVGKYALVRTLGQGTYAKVKYAIDTVTHTGVAIKVIEKAKINTNALTEQLKREITVMKRFSHPAVVEIIEVFTTKSKIYIVMELVLGGDLLDKIENSTEGYLDEQTAMTYFISIVDALAICHSHDVCHRDLKPENLMVTADNQIKITDFGMSSLGGGPHAVLDTVCGTPNYVAPEVLEGKGYNGKVADIWSIGCILFVMMAGELAFDGPKKQMFENISHLQHTPFPDHVTEPARNFIDFILSKERPSLDQIRKHRFFQKFAPRTFGMRRPSNFRLRSVSSKFLEKQQATPRSNKQTKTAEGPMQMNVLELITVSLGLDIASGMEYRRPTNNNNNQTTQQLRSVHRFATTRPPKLALISIATAIEAVGGNVLRLIEANCKIKGEVFYDTGRVKFSTRIIQLLPETDTVVGVFMVETTKMQGSTKLFGRFYRSVCDHPSVDALVEKKK